MRDQHIDIERRVHQGLEYVRRTVDLDWEHEGGYITPLYDLFDSFPITIREVESLTYRRAAQFVATQTGHEAILALKNAEQPLAGLLYAYKYQSICRACILVRQNDLIERRRFTVAHELGHYILHFIPLVGSAPSDGVNMPVILEGLLHTDEETFSDEKDTAEVTMNDAVPATHRMSIEQMEQEANAFAAALLVPEAACRKLYEVYRPRYGDHRAVLERRIATDFLVSRFAMHRRLETLGLGKA